MVCGQGPGGRLGAGVRQGLQGADDTMFEVERKDVEILHRGAHELGGLFALVEQGPLEPWSPGVAGQGQEVLEGATGFGARVLGLVQEGLQAFGGQPAPTAAQVSDPGFCALPRCAQGAASSPGSVLQAGPELPCVGAFEGLCGGHEPAADALVELILERFDGHEAVLQGLPDALEGAVLQELEIFAVEHTAGAEEAAGWQAEASRVAGDLTTQRFEGAVCLGPGVGGGGPDPLRPPLLEPSQVCFSVLALLLDLVELGRRVACHLAGPVGEGTEHFGGEDRRGLVDEALLERLDEGRPSGVVQGAVPGVGGFVPGAPRLQRTEGEDAQAAALQIRAQVGEHRLALGVVLKAVDLVDDHEEAVGGCFDSPQVVELGLGEGLTSVEDPEDGVGFLEGFEGPVLMPFHGGVESGGVPEVDGL